MESKYVYILIKVQTLDGNKEFSILDVFEDEWDAISDLAYEQDENDQNNGASFDVIPMKLRRGRN